MLDSYSNWYWRISDGRIWGSKEAAWIEESAIPAGFSAQTLYNDGMEADEAYLIETIRFYNCGLGNLATIEEMQQKFTDAIQAHLDAFARTRNYDGILSVATYATSAMEQFWAEGQYAVEARDATWAKGYEILDAVMAGARPMPTLEEVIAELPPLVWPN